MSSTALAGTAPGFHGAASSPFAWIGAFLRSWRGEAELPAAIADAVALVGSRMLGAPDRAGVRECLDEVAFDPAFNRALMALVKGFKSQELSQERPALDEAVRDVLGFQASKIIEDLLPLADAAAVALTGHDFSISSDDLEGFAVSLPQLFYDPETPSVVGRAFLAGLRASAMSLAILHACRKGQRLEPWLAVAFAEEFRDGVREYLPFYFALLNVTPPAGMRTIDLGAVFADHRVANARLLAFEAEAEASNQDVYVPRDD